jgi:hypothetical protein
MRRFAEAEAAEPEARLRAAYAALRPAARVRARLLMTPWAAGLTAAPGTRLDAVMAGAPPQRPELAPSVTTTYDPAHVRDVANRIWSLAVASRGRVGSLRTALPCPAGRLCSRALVAPEILTRPGAPDTEATSPLTLAGGQLTFTGGPARPLLVVRGIGFGTAPRRIHLAGCPSQIYAPGVLGFRDETRGWDAGRAPASGEPCVGIRIASWTRHRLVLRFGRGYGGRQGVVAHTGDTYTITIKGRELRGNVAYRRR